MFNIYDTLRLNKETPKAYFAFPPEDKKNKWQINNIFQWFIFYYRIFLQWQKEYTTWYKGGKFVHGVRSRAMATLNHFPGTKKTEKTLWKYFRL